MGFLEEAVLYPAFSGYKFICLILHNEYATALPHFSVRRATRFKTT